MEVLFEFIEPGMVLNILVSIAVLFVVSAFMSAATALRDSERMKQHESTLNLIHRLAMTFIQNANGLSEDDLARYQLIGEERGLSFDPRMIFVMTRIERMIESRTGTDIDIFDIYEIAQGVYKSLDK